MSQRYNHNTKGSKSKENQRGILKMYVLPRNSVENFASRRGRCWGYVSLYENTHKKLPQLYLVVQGRA